MTTNLADEFSPCFFKGEGDFKLSDMTLPPVRERESTKGKRANLKPGSRYKLFRKRMDEQGFRIVIDTDFNFIGLAKDANSAAMVFVRDTNGILESQPGPKNRHVRLKLGDARVVEFRGAFVVGVKGDEESLDALATGKLN